MTATSIPRPIGLGQPELSLEPPGERYYRHPGDVVRGVLWAIAAVVLLLFIEVTSATSDGLTTDLGRAAARVSQPVRELTLALSQVVAVVVPVAIVAVLIVGRRFRRLGLLLLGATAGAAILTLLDVALDLPGRLPDAVTRGTWVASTRFPNLAYVAGASSAAMIGKPWLSRPWRRAVDLAVVASAATIAFAGSGGLPELVFASAVGAVVGALILVIFGAPNRRPAPVAVAAALREAGVDVDRLALERAVGGRSQLYRAATTDGRNIFVKVYAQDSRDADLLYRSYRALVLRDASDRWLSASLESNVRHEALLLLLAGRAGLSFPALEALTVLADGSMVLAMTDVGGRPLDTLQPDEIDAELLDAIWREVQLKDSAHIAHRALRAGNVLVSDHRPVVIDLGFGEESATERLVAIDRAELLTSLASLVGAAPAVASAARVLDPVALAGAAPYVQPLALSASTRKQVPKLLLRAIREEIAAATGEEPQPLEQLVRVKPKTVVTIAALAGAFYFLLPQLANVGDSVHALRSASWPWLLVCIAMSLSTYVASVIGLRGGVREHLPFGPTIEAQIASSFVNRVTPANVGGMALNVRYMQKAGVEPADAVTGVSLNVAAGGIVHVLLMFVFFAWARQSTSEFSVPGGSKLLAILAIVLALVGIVMATRRGRRLARKHVVEFARRAWTSTASVASSPLRLVELLGGSIAVTLAYITALAAATQAFHGGVSFAEVGAVFLGSSMIAAAAPTPGGLGAMEAALVAGFTAIGMESGVAVATVLSYRLATYWLPVLPGWLCFRDLEKRNFI